MNRQGEEWCVRCGVVLAYRPADPALLKPRRPEPDGNIWPRSPAPEPAYDPRSFGLIDLPA